MKKKGTITIVLISLLPFFGLSQQSKVGNWFIYFGNQKINHKWNFWNEVQYRNYNFAGDLQQLLIRTGLGLSLIHI
jgi:hypothetical protein